MIIEQEGSKRGKTDWLSLDDCSILVRCSAFDIDISTFLEVY